jgi:prepilin-type N-terminal cleavage/methylation domain-containing protein
MKENYSKQTGFTLIEVLVSIVILSIILTTFFSFFGQSLVFSGKNEEKLVAYNLAGKTLRIVESKYKNTINQSLLTLDSCTNYPQELKDVLDNSTCSFIQNKKNYFPEIIITKQTFTEFTNPKLYLINVKIYNANKLNSNRKLLSETFGYIRGL